MITEEIKNKVDSIFKLYESYGNESYGENVTQLQHMLQCAQIAKKDGADDELILAAFFHDIGHLLESENTMEKMGKWGLEKHDYFGGEFLAKLGFSDKITQLVAGHVNAKRYLTFSKPGYLEGLSKASRETLEFQGGIMTEIEARKFECDNYFKDHVQVRLWDDLGKIEGLEISEHELNFLKEMTFLHLSNNISKN
jgi:phosphonate degradation associated HDIG domain protein